jgi:hypothetical protein
MRVQPLHFPPLRSAALLGAVSATLLVSGPPGLAARRSKKAASPPPVKATTVKKPKAAPLQFNPSTMELGPGEEDILEIRLLNPYGHPTIGSLRLHPPSGVTVTPSEWNGPLPPWGAKFYAHVKAADAHANGTLAVPVRYFVDRSGEYGGEMTVEIKTPVEAELIPDYRSQDEAYVRVRVKNLLSKRTERGRVGLKSSARLLQDQVSAILPPVPPGETREVSIPVTPGGIAPGQGYRFTATVQTWPGYSTTLSQTLVFYGELK